MSSGAAWAGLAGLAQGIGSALKQRHDDEQDRQKEADKEKLYQLQQDAQTKREQFLIDYRVNAEAEKAQNKHDLEKDDVVGQFTDPETKNVYGRTKSGLVVPLNQTSSGFQSNLGAIQQGNAAHAQMKPELDQARLDSTTSNIANRTSEINARDNKPVNDPDVNRIRTSFENHVGQAKKDYAKSVAELQKAGTAAKDIPPFDEDAAQTNAKAALYLVWGGDKVNSVLTDHAPSQSRPAPSASTPSPGTTEDANSSLAAQSPQRSQTQPGAPTAQEILQQANLAFQKAGKDPQKQAAIQARVQQLFQQYGYNPQ